MEYNSSLNPHLTLEELDALTKILRIRYSAYLGDKTISIKELSQKDVIHFEVLLTSRDESFFYPIEVSSEISTHENKKQIKEAQFLLLDFVGLYLDEFFKSEEATFLPIDWQQFPCEDRIVFMRGQIRNLKLEKQADELLKAH